VNPAERYNARERELDSIEPAWAKAAFFFRTGLKFVHDGGIGGASLGELHDELEARRERVKQGETLDLLSAVNTCAQANMPLPSWLAASFRAALRRYGAQASSLDDVFRSTTLRTGKRGRLDRKRARQLAGSFDAPWPWIRARASAFTGWDGAIDAFLKEHGSFPLGKTSLRENLVKCDRLQCDLGGIAPVSDLWGSKPKRPNS